MSEQHGDKARFNRLRKAKIHRREHNRDFRVNVDKRHTPSRAPKKEMTKKAA